MVSGNENHLPVRPQPPSECTQYRFGGRESFLRVVLRELDHVAEQDQPLDLSEDIEQDAERRAAPQDIPLVAHAEV